MKKYKLVYVEAGNLKGSYSGIPAKDDPVLISRAVLEGVEEPSPAIPDGYILPEGVLNIIKNGTVDIAKYAKVSVNVPVPEGYVIPEGQVLITENGEVDVAGKASVLVQVDIPEGYLKPEGTKNIRANGENIDVKEFEFVNVDIPGATIYDTYNVDANGTYDIAEYANVNVDVPIPEGYVIPTGKPEQPITENGTNINVAGYAAVDVNVPVPPEYVIPTGKIEITENGSNIDVAGKAAVDVNVPNPVADLTENAWYRYTGDEEYPLDEIEDLSLESPRLVEDGVIPEDWDQGYIYKHYSAGCGPEFEKIDLPNNGEHTSFEDGDDINYDIFRHGEALIPSGSMTIEENGDNIDVTNKASVNVRVPDPTANFTAVEVTDVYNNGYLYRYSGSRATVYLAGTNEQLEEADYTDVGQAFNLEEDGIYKFGSNYGFSPVEIPDLPSNSGYYYFDGTDSFTDFDIQWGLNWFGSHGTNDIKLLNLDSGTIYKYDGGSSFTEVFFGSRGYHFFDDSTNTLDPNLANLSDMAEQLGLIEDSYYYYDGSNMVSKSNLDLADDMASAGVGYYYYAGSDYVFESANLSEDTVYYYHADDSYADIQYSLDSCEVESNHFYCYEGNGSFAELETNSAQAAEALFGDGLHGSELKLVYWNAGSHAYYVEQIWDANEQPLDVGDEVTIEIGYAGTYKITKVAD